MEGWRSTRYHGIAQRLAESAWVAEVCEGPLPLQAGGHRAFPEHSLEMVGGRWGPWVWGLLRAWARHRELQVVGEPQGQHTQLLSCSPLEAPGPCPFCSSSSHT